MFHTPEEALAVRQTQSFIHGRMTRETKFLSCTAHKLWVQATTCAQAVKGTTSRWCENHRKLPLAEQLGAKQTDPKWVVIWASLELFGLVPNSFQEKLKDFPNL